MGTAASGSRSRSWAARRSTAAASSASSSGILSEHLFDFMRGTYQARGRWQAPTRKCGELFHVNRTKQSHREQRRRTTGPEHRTIVPGQHMGPDPPCQLPVGLLNDDLATVPGKFLEANLLEPRSVPRAAHGEHMTPHRARRLHGARPAENPSARQVHGPREPPATVPGVCMGPEERCRRGPGGLGATGWGAPASGG
jgi:hypothetical protein